MNIALLAAALLLSACAGWDPADDGGRSSSYSSTPDGHYRVRRGDSLYAIAFNFGLDWRDLAAWNAISSPYVIYPDQLLRLESPPGYRRQAAVETRAAPAPAAAETRTVPERKAESRPVEADPTPSEASAQESPPPANTASPAAKPAVSASDPKQWKWPTEGRVVSSFRKDDPSRKGIDIGGKAGQKIVASAPGQVVYSGSGMIGYGELIIIKHSDRMLSAYAHNRKRLVVEGDSVQAGTHIAEMGSNDRNQSLLHFEIRVNGVPSDPLQYLPRR